MENPLMDSGTVRKDAIELVVTFNTQFTSIPNVVISPFWPGGQSGNIDTITAISRESFTVQSQNISNQAGVYQISWFAFQPA